MIPLSFLAIITGYLLGSVPWAYLLGRGLGHGDIRRLGDGNMGAANAFRQLGSFPGLGVGLLDAGKGAATIAIAWALGVPNPVVFLSGTAAVVGHNWPAFLHFRGGRGAATTLGVLLALLPVPTSILSGAALAPLLVTRSTTVACAIIFAPLPLLAWAWGASLPLVASSLALPCLVGYTHFRRAKEVAFAAPGSSTL